LYATTLFGLPLVARKSVLVPTAHDEPFLYEDVYKILFHLPRHIVYLTEAEREIAHRVTGNGRIPHTVTALGITAPPQPSAARFRQKYGVEGEFILYGGRIAFGKNVPQLLDFFLHYRSETDHPVKLVLMGQADLAIPQHPDIIPIGFVSTQDKFDALQAATAVIQPSLFESLSIIILEAWLMKKPVIVQGRCAVTKQQCRRSHGGLYYSTFHEFALVLTRLLNSPSLRTQLGQQGHEFVAKQYSWETVMTAYQRLASDLVE
jgi:glycosyltransferase involved in cell wall biosynthesis